MPKLSKADIPSGSGTNSSVGTQSKRITKKAPRNQKRKRLGFKKKIWENGKMTGKTPFLIDKNGKMIKIDELLNEHKGYCSNCGGLCKAKKGSLECLNNKKKDTLKPEESQGTPIPKREKESISCFGSPSGWTSPKPVESHGTPSPEREKESISCFWPPSGWTSPKPVESHGTSRPKSKGNFAMLSNLHSGLESPKSSCTLLNPLTPSSPWTSPDDKEKDSDIPNMQILNIAIENLTRNSENKHQSNLERLNFGDRNGTGLLESNIPDFDDYEGPIRNDF